MNSCVRSSLHRPDANINTVDYSKVRSVTQQQFKEVVSIKNIMSRYMRTGNIDHLSNTRAIYADFSTIGDYQDCLERVKAAQDNFNQLPARVREHFRNDAGALIDFVLNPANKKEAQALGLIDKDPPPPVVNPAPAAPVAAVPPVAPEPVQK